MRYINDSSEVDEITANNNITTLSLLKSVFVNLKFLVPHFNETDSLFLFIIFVIPKITNIMNYNILGEIIYIIIL